MSVYRVEISVRDRCFFMRSVALMIITPWGSPGHWVQTSDHWIYVNCKAGIGDVVHEAALWIRTRFLNSRLRFLIRCIGFFCCCFQGVMRLTLWLFLSQLRVVVFSIKVSLHFLNYCVSSEWCSRGSWFAGRLAVLCSHDYSICNIFVHARMLLNQRSFYNVARFSMHQSKLHRVARLVVESFCATSLTCKVICKSVVIWPSVWECTQALKFIAVSRGVLCLSKIMSACA